MSGQNEQETLDSGAKAADDTTAAHLKRENDAGGRQRSTIAFPYNDLADAAHVAQAIMGNVGHGECDDSQLAAWLDQSPKSSSFRTQISAARMFGVIESDGNGKHKLAPLGQQIVDTGQEREAKVHAFLNVPLYKAAYEKYKGTVVPPTAALELEFVRLGVSEKQKDRARAVFNKSAEQAGFFEQGKNRLVQPGIAPKSAADAAKTANNDKQGNGGNGGDDGEGLRLDPLLTALLRKIPSKTEGWSGAKRVRWFRTFAMNVSQVYDDDESPVEMEIKLHEGNDG